MNCISSLSPRDGAVLDAVNRFDTTWRGSAALESIKQVPIEFLKKIE
jgi:hypothetical protein